mmetsp:Transcript_14538/g.41246  ORF Transcript_14538/g.41246 Transcript_14538/m.41246 type:complete len:277 (-) Transcript_14538:30-860(-)
MADSDGMTASLHFKTILTHRGLQAIRACDEVVVAAHVELGLDRGAGNDGNGKQVGILDAGPTSHHPGIRSTERDPLVVLGEAVLSRGKVVESGQVLQGLVRGKVAKVLRSVKLAHRAGCLIVAAIVPMLQHKEERANLRYPLCGIVTVHGFKQSGVVKRRAFATNAKEDRRAATRDPKLIVDVIRLRPGLGVQRVKVVLAGLEVERARSQRPQRVARILIDNVRRRINLDGLLRSKALPWLHCGSAATQLRRVDDARHQGQRYCAGEHLAAHGCGR